MHNRNCHGPTQVLNGILMRGILKFKTVVGREDVPIPLVYLHVPYREWNGGMDPTQASIVFSAYLSLAVDALNNRAVSSAYILCA